MTAQDEHRNGLGQAAFGAAVITAVAGGLLTAVLAGALAAGVVGMRAADPLTSKKLEAMKNTLRANPADGKLRSDLQELDLELRRQYFQQQTQLTRGAWLLLACLGITAFAALGAIHLRRLPPMPPMAPIKADMLGASRLARWSLGALAIVIIGGAGVLGVTTRDWSPPAPAVAAAPEPRILPTADQVVRNWPRFRGPNGSGISAFTNVPDTWDAATGLNILWKMPVPLGGENSPVLWGDRVFLVGADKTRREVYCFDANGGKMLWQKRVENVPGSAAWPPEVQQPQPGFAASTGCCDGQRVYVIFPNMDVACLAFDGRELWKRNLGPLDIHYGYAASLVCDGDKLLVMFDQGTVEDGKSRLLALDVTTGRTVWQAKRPVDMSWTTPVVTDTPGGRVIITSSKPYVIAHRLTDGTELWRAKLMDGEVAPSPVTVGPVAYVVNQGAVLAAVRIDGSGDVTSSNVVWTGRDEDNIALPDICSPLCDGKLLFLLDSGGIFTCVDAADGKKLWEHQLPGSYNTSPSMVGDKVYLINTDGAATIVQAGREYKELGKANLGEGVSTSPAFVDGRIYIRGKDNLFCIGAKAP